MRAVPLPFFEMEGLTLIKKFSAWRQWALFIWQKPTRLTTGRRQDDFRSGMLGGQR